MKNKKTVTSIGEFGVIWIVRDCFFGKKKKSNIEGIASIVADIGDDAFCFMMGRQVIGITKDLLIEGVHFDLRWTNAFDLAQKSIEVNVSDIAAMGSLTPKYVFIGLGLPPNTPIDFVKDFTKGLKSICDKYGIFVAGGDTVKADKIVISVTAVGIGKNKIVKRSGARKGDLIGVTNTFGDSAVGLMLLSKFGSKHKFNKEEKFLIAKHIVPKACLKEANLISRYISSLTDASDGLHFSIDLLTKESKKGAQINVEKIPISKQMSKVIANKKDKIQYALFGGEDYELVFTVSPTKAKLLKNLVPQISYIGKITKSKEVLYFNEDKKQNFKNSTFKHF
jgi:thiamine-monophosphate kinase